MLEGLLIHYKPNMLELIHYGENVLTNFLDYLIGQYVTSLTIH